MVLNIIILVILVIGVSMVYIESKGSFKGYISVVLISISSGLISRDIMMNKGYLNKDVLMDYVNGDIKMIVDKKIYKGDTIMTDTLFYDIRSKKYLE